MYFGAANRDPDQFANARRSGPVAQLPMNMSPSAAARMFCLGQAHRPAGDDAILVEVLTRMKGP